MNVRSVVGSLQLPVAVMGLAVLSLAVGLGWRAAAAARTHLEPRIP